MVRNNERGVWELTDSEMSKAIVLIVDAAQQYKRDGYRTLENEAYKLSTKIYETLKKVGYCKEVK